MSVSTLLRRHAGSLSATALLLALCVKFFWPLMRFGLPMGYDLGIYRYLFLKHAEGLPPFSIASMQPWAYEHPLGLFFFSTILLKLGVPVDWLTGWIWNLMPVILGAVLAWAWRRREGGAIGALVLLCLLCSQAYFDGFASMYWKTYLSLLFTVLTFSSLERRSWMGVFWGILAVATHHQTGLILGLTVGLWVMARWVRSAWRGRLLTREFAFGLGAGLLILAAGILWYLPIWSIAVQPQLARILSAQSAGSFPSLSYYVSVTPILLAFGVYGYVRSWKYEQGTPWQIAVLVCFLFVALQLMFFRRFFLQLDFFLLPFAALGIRDVWRRFSGAAGMVFLIAVLTAQALLSVHAAAQRTPPIDTAAYEAVRSLPGKVPAGAMVIALDNQSAPFLLGWLPDAYVGGPGLFSYPLWTYEQWEQFIDGTHEDRVTLLATLQRPAYVYASPYFHQFYGDRADRVIADSCFERQDDPYLLKVVCAAPKAK